jgi:hypothetical protein
MSVAWQLSPGTDSLRYDHQLAVVVLLGLETLPSRQWALLNARRALVNVSPRSEGTHAGVPLCAADAAASSTRRLRAASSPASTAAARILASSCTCSALWSASLVLAQIAHGAGSIANARARKTETIIAQTAPSATSPRAVNINSLMLTPEIRNKREVGS